MKKIFILFFAAICAVSCFDGGSGVGQKYNLITYFQYSGINFRSDSTFVNYKDTVGFGYDVLNFYHELDEGLVRAEGGFFLSCAEMPKSGVTEGLQNTYRAMVPKGMTPGNIYTVFYQNPDDTKMPEHDVEFSFPEYGTCQMVGCYVTNTVEVVDYVKKHFTLGDRLSIKATGYANGQKTGEAEMILADYSAQKDSIVTQWSVFDLAKLKMVEYVDFELISSKPDVPSYFCMDNMVAEISLEY